MKTGPRAFTIVPQGCLREKRGWKGAVMKKPYEAPKVYELGTVEELTQNGVEKAGGSGDQFLPCRPEDDFGTSSVDGCDD